MDQPEGGGLDGGRTRACCGVAPTGLGGAQSDQLVGATLGTRPGSGGARPLHPRPRTSCRRRASTSARTITIPKASPPNPTSPSSAPRENRHERGAGAILKEPWRDLGRQREGAAFGIWICLASEVLFFGSLLLLYTVYSVENPQAFAAAARETDIFYGTVNTAVLLTSSLTMAVAAQGAEAKADFIA